MSATGIISHLDAGAGALRRGDPQRARDCFLHAARELLLLARESRGAVRAARAEQARRLIEQSQRLHGAQNPDAGIENSGEAKQSEATAGSSAIRPTESPDLALDDVAGAEDVKRVFKAKFLYPLMHPDRAAAYRQSGAGGVLLYGPPGTGKTYLARALAGELRAPVFTIKPSDIMSKWVGDSEQNVAKLFEEARKNKVALIFIDEIDALAPGRDTDASGVADRVLAQLLAELDGFRRHESRLLFVGASNEPWNIDQALLRTGRFDVLCYVGLPDADARTRILVDFLKGVPLDPSVNLVTVARDTEGCTGAEVFAVANHAAQAAYYDVIETGNDRPVAMADFEQAIAGIHRAATPELLQRYREFGGTDGQ